VELTVAFIAFSDSKAGTYTVSAVFTSKNQSYTNAEAMGTITITPALPIVAVTGSPLVYNGLAQSASCTATGVNAVPVPGSCSFTYNGSVNPPTNVGSYSVTASFTSSNADYQDATGVGKFKIVAAQLIITANNATFVPRIYIPDVLSQLHRLRQRRDVGGPARHAED
jgi:hypothetical protein